jgi:pyridoxine 4-dehydrogenase
MQQPSAIPSGTFDIGGDLRVHRLGFGAMRVTGPGIWGEPADPAEARRVLARLPEVGVDLIDTADSYGPFVSEDLLREVLHPYQGLVVATKGGLTRHGPDVWKPVGRPEYLRQCVLMSLRRLAVERIDLWQLHRIDPLVPRDEQFGVMRAMRDEGLIRHLGLSQVTVADVDEARRHFPVATVQNLFHLARRDSEDVWRTARRTASASSRGSRSRPAASPGPAACSTGIAQRLGATHGQVALAWLLRRSPVMLPIPGTGRLDHLEENVAASTRSARRRRRRCPRRGGRGRVGRVEPGGRHGTESDAALGLAIATTLLLLGACGPAAPTGPNRDPVASFTTSFSGTEVTFDAGISFDPDGDPLAYAWDFGDGASASGVVAVHRYTEPGAFVAELTVSDGRGGVDTATATVPVGEVAGDLAVLGGAPSGPWRRTRRPRRRADAATGRRPAAPAPFVPGEVIVLFAEGVRPASASLRVAGVVLERVRDLALPGAVLVPRPIRRRTGRGGRHERRRGDVGARAGPAGAARRRRRPPELPRAAPRGPQRPGLRLQWHLPAIGLQQAWDVTTGRRRHRRRRPRHRHPLPRDRHDPAAPRPRRPGPARLRLRQPRHPLRRRRRPRPRPVRPDPDAGYHGTHVAGTIAAATNNGVGIAGVDWAARVLPVRVMGAGGGPLSDVMDGLLWSAGVGVSACPTNANPAHVVNLSLGANVACSSTFQQTIDLVVEGGVTIVVSAGNEQASVDTSFPANCRDVIAVGATDRAGKRAWYSNHGPRVDVMAPGGDMRTRAADGVYSLGRDPGGAFGYTYAQGTSMAAAHVSGVVALMLSLEDLAPDEVRALLRLTANPLTAAECTAGYATTLPGSACGAGLIDAAAAVASLGPTPPPPPPPPPAAGELAFEPGQLDFGPVTASEDAGAADHQRRRRPVDWAIVDFVEAADNPVLLQNAPDTYEVAVSTAFGQLAPGASTTVQITITLGRRPSRASTAWTSPSSRTAWSGACRCASRYRATASWPPASAPTSGPSGSPPTARSRCSA